VSTRTPLLDLSQEVQGITHRQMNERTALLQDLDDVAKRLR
jgi:hypothetical protein